MKMIKTMKQKYKKVDDYIQLHYNFSLLFLLAVGISFIILVLFMLTDLDVIVGRATEKIINTIDGFLFSPYVSIVLLGVICVILSLCFLGLLFGWDFAIVEVATLVVGNIIIYLLCEMGAGDFVKISLAFSICCSFILGIVI